jgi:hypothetical protein
MIDDFGGQIYNTDVADGSPAITRGGSHQIFLNSYQKGFY